MHSCPDINKKAQKELEKQNDIIEQNQEILEGEYSYA